MEAKLNMPRSYTVIEEEEMCYVDGGAVNVYQVIYALEDIFGAFGFSGTVEKESSKETEMGGGVGANGGIGAAVTNYLRNLNRVNWDFNGQRFFRGVGNLIIALI